MLDTYDNMSQLQNIREKEYIEELRVSNLKLQQANEIIERSSIIVFDWAITPGVPVKFVTNNISMFGYTSEDFYNGNVDYWDIVHPDDVEKTQDLVWQNRIQNVSEYKHTYRVICSNGDIKWVEEWTLLERDKTGKLIAEKGILRDITEQVEIAERLKQSEERYRSLFENACAIIFTVSPSGDFTSANKSCIDITGYNIEQLLAMNISQLAISDNLYKLLQPNPAQFSNMPVEFQIRGSNNKIITLEGKSSYVSSSYENNITVPMEIQIIAQDVTSRKAAEERVIHLSYHDRLTGLYNRAYFEESLQKLNVPEMLPISIIIGDMNSLKLANDAFGHKAGDSLLLSTARIIESVCSPAAVISRFGGDEFAVILPKTTKNETMEICNRIRVRCAMSSSNPIQPSIALGYSTKTHKEENISDIIREADDNMYRNKLNESKSIRSSIISSLKTTLEERTIETSEHAERLKKISLKLGRALGFSESKLDELAIASIMHDIGKIAIPDSILLKQGKLSEDEWLTMKKHPEIGYHIMLSSPKMASIAEYILAHHEKWDGTGYPQKLKGDEIPIISRIISIADAFDVMTHDRIYCAAKTKEEAVEEIKRCSGSQFDPDLVNVFLRII